MHGVDDPLAELTGREREVLALLAIGRSDLGISETLFVTRKTVEFHTRNIFRKLGLPASGRDNRRVHAVLTFLQQEGGDLASGLRDPTDTGNLAPRVDSPMVG